MNFKIFTFYLLFLFQTCFLNFFASESKDSYFFSARYHNPKIGRFVSPDTQTPGDFQSPSGLNRYSYAFNSPLKYNDPDGHNPQSSSDDESGKWSRKMKYARKAHRIAKKYPRRIAKVHAKHLKRKVVTGTFVLENGETSNIDSKVVTALQRLAGNLATIGAEAGTNKIGNVERHGWWITYQPTLVKPNDKGIWNESWFSLKDSLDSSTSSYNAIGSQFLIELLDFHSDRGTAFRERLDGSIGSTLPITDKSTGTTHYLIRAITDVKSLPHFPNPDDELPLVLGHELKHAQYFTEGKPTKHFPLFFHYIFNDDPIYATDVLYRKAYNNNQTEDSKIPESPAFGTSNKYGHMKKGYAVRKVFESMGIQVTKMKPEE